MYADAHEDRSTCKEAPAPPTHTRVAACSALGGFYGFEMAVDLNVREGHAARCNRIAPLPASEQ